MLVVQHNEQVVGGRHQVASLECRGIDRVDGDGNRHRAARAHGIREGADDRRQLLVIRRHEPLQVDHHAAIVSRSDATRDLARCGRERGSIGSQLAHGIWVESSAYRVRDYRHQLHASRRRTGKRVTEFGERLSR